jgi:hypothetical protein
MKIAVCFSGQVRTGVETFPVLRKFFGNLFSDIDFFIHTWTNNSISKWALDNRDPSIAYAIFPADGLEEIKVLYKPKSMIVNDLPVYNKKITDERRIKFSSVNPMFSSIYESNKLKTQYEHDHGFTYDIVLRLRFDQIFDINNTLSKEIDYFLRRSFNDHLNLNRLSTCDYHNKLPYAVDDIAWIAKSKDMDLACNFVFERENKSNNNTGILLDWQQHFKDYLEENQIRPHNWKNNNLYIYRDYHALKNVSPFDTDLLV